MAAGNADERPGLFSDEGETRGHGGVVAAPHTLSTAAGAEALRTGGNAVDAAVAACAVQGVVAPETCGVGGDLFALVHRPGEPLPLALNASGRAGSGVDAAALRAEGHRVIPGTHPAAITVPGCVDGWVTLCKRLGWLPIADVLAPAIRLADAGFPAGAELVAAVSAGRDRLRHQEAAWPLLDAVTPGATVVRRQLAETLRAIADGGRQAFYDAAPGAAITAATHGVVTADDLRRDQADWATPLGVDVWGARAWTMPPNSQGYLAIGACALLERLGGDESRLDPQDPRALHLMIEAYRAVAAERGDVVVDPGLLPLPADRLLAGDRLDAIAAGVDPESALERHRPGPGAGGTAYLCAVDADGLGVSLIQSNFRGIGTGLGAGSAGFLLHDRGLGFNLETGHPGELAPGRRPLHTLSPTLWTRDGRLRLLLGTRGGHVQPQIVLQIAAGVVGQGLGPGSAQARPRWTVDVPSAGSRGSYVRVEPETPDRVVGDLRRRGHQVVVESAPRPGWGPVSLIDVDPSGGRAGARDPRVATTSVVAT